MLKNRNEIVVERSTRLSGEALLRRGYQVLHIFNGHNLKADKNIYIQSHNENLLSFQVQLHPVSRQLSIFEDPETENDFVNSELIFSYDQNIQIEVPVRADGSILDIRSSR